MVRVREILDPELKQKIVAALAERRGMSVAAIPEWYELDDADYVDLLNDIKEAESPRPDDWHDPRAGARDDARDDEALSPRPSPPPRPSAGAGPSGRRGVARKPTPARGRRA